MARESMEHEQTRVRAGWHLVDQLGRLSEADGKRRLSKQWDGARSRAANSLQPFAKRPGEWSRLLYESPSNQTRFRHTLDFIQPGDRVFEVGPGGGYLAALLLRDGKVASYHGIDLYGPPVRKAQKFLQGNGLAEAAHVSQRNLYDLTRADVESLDINVLMCCEVLEHVPDPETAMKTLASVLPSNAELLITVPLHGRLETIWGHIAIFDTARIQKMIAQSGLLAHAVQVIDNRWVLVLASHDPEPSARAARAAGAARAATDHGDLDAEGFALVSGSDEIPVETDPFAPTGFRALGLGPDDVQPSVRNAGLSAYHLECGSDGVVCELAADGPRFIGRRRYGGIRIPVAAPRGLRIELGFDSVRAVRAFEVDAYAGDERIARWRGNPRILARKRDRRTTVLRPGRDSAGFRTLELGPLETADAFDVVAVVRPGRSARFRLIRAAVVF
jgi:2-polyprenyl-3-methyl-5-hydroxy-6-metoxy-1,4-benzoquinol methylase